MVISFLLIIYNLVTAFTAGLVFTKLAGKVTAYRYSALHPAILVFSGWLFMAIQLQLYHLFRPADAGAHFLVWFINIAGVGVRFKDTVKDAITSLHQVATKKHVFFAGGLLALTVLNICTRNADGDIGDYHLQAIRWMEEYKVVPGLGNIRRQLGNNSNWFLLNAFSGLHFLGLRSVYTLNACLVLVCGLFVVPQLSQSFWLRNFFLLLYFIIIATRKYTGAVTNDVVITGITIVLFCWFTDIIQSMSQRAPEFFLMILLTAGLITYKLSALPMLVFAAGVFWLLVKFKEINVRRALVLFFFGVMLFVPWLVTNILHSGYLIFPVKASRLFNVDWAMRAELIDYEKYANLAYARVPMADIEVSRYFGFTQWFPLWIKSLDTFSMLLLCGCAVFMVLMVVLLVFKQHTRQLFIERYYWIIASTVIVALFLWFTHGPTPRFVFGYLVFINVMGIALISPDVLSVKLYKYKYRIAGLFMIVLFGAFVYRNFKIQTLKEALLIPKPYIQPSLMQMSVDGGVLFVPEKNQQPWDSPLPCTNLPDSSLQFRGKGLVHGFRIKR